MTTDGIRSAYLQFFKDRDHAIIPPAPLVPPNDPTTLFTSSGMQQLVPYLKGEPHSMGKRLVDSQPCFRSEDINEVGDNRHTTLFTMLGNWSLGDYFKKEQLAWIWEFFTGVLNLPKNRLYVTVFAGGSGIPKDEETFSIWQEIGIAKDHIFYYPAEKNWWSRSGTPDKMPAGEIGGPDSEVFYEFNEVKHDPKFGQTCHPNCDCGRFLEIGNSVFMQYEKQVDGSFKPLPKQNVDFGGGLERLAAACQDTPDIFQIDIFKPIIKKIETNCHKDYKDYNQAPMRIIADHLRAAEAMFQAGVKPSNKLQGYMLRRLIRRSAVKMHELKGELIPEDFPESFRGEIAKFKNTLDRGLKEFNKFKDDQFNALNAFNLFQTYGFPFEVTAELFKQKGHLLDKNEFDQVFSGHKKLSRTASAGMFKAGLADHSEIVTKLHTVTHLFHAALRQILGSHVQQEGSNITSERLRFDFSHPQALTAAEISQIEALINQKIKEDLPVKKTIIDKDSAIKSGALAFFKETYPDKVSVYTIGNFSKELCSGPHVDSTAKIGSVKIIKQESIGAGKRRLYAVLNHGTQKSAHQT